MLVSRRCRKPSHASPPYPLKCPVATDAHHENRIVRIFLHFFATLALRADLDGGLTYSKWWELTQDERRTIFEDRSMHISVGLKYLPSVARRLHHCRDLCEAEPFDFVTLFDYAKADAAAFDEMLAIMRASEEWKYVEREVDIRLVRID